MSFVIVTVSELQNINQSLDQLSNVLNIRSAKFKALEKMAFIERLSKLNVKTNSRYYGETPIQKPFNDFYFPDGKKMSVKDTLKALKHLFDNVDPKYATGYEVDAYNQLSDILNEAEPALLAHEQSETGNSSLINNETEPAPDNRKKHLDQEDVLYLNRNQTKWQIWRKGKRTKVTIIMEGREYTRVIKFYEEEGKDVFINFSLKGKDYRIKTDQYSSDSRPVVEIDE